MVNDLRFAVLAADTCLFTLKGNELLVRLVHVERPPHFPDNWGLPGGLIDPKETADAAAKRFVEKKALVSAAKTHLEQLYTMSEIERDPRGRVVAVAYLGLVPWEEMRASEQADHAHARWVNVKRVPKLAYDHDTILAIAQTRLRSRITYTTVMQALMPARFTLPELEQAYATVLGKPIDRRNFRKKFAKLKLLEELASKKTGGRHRPAKLYRFKSKKIVEIEVL